MVKGYKYGILYAKEGQVEEEKMFCNSKCHNSRTVVIYNG